MVRNPPANVGGIRDKGLIPGSGRSLGEGMETHSSILALEIRGVWQASPRGHKESDMTEHTAQAHRELGKEARAWTLPLCRGLGKHP